VTAEKTLAIDRVRVYSFGALVVANSLWLESLGSRKVHHDHAAKDAGFGTTTRIELTGLLEQRQCALEQSQRDIDERIVCQGSGLCAAGWRFDSLHCF
jgi:hypothetical protein